MRVFHDGGDAENEELRREASGPRRSSARWRSLAVVGVVIGLLSEPHGRATHRCEPPPPPPPDDSMYWICAVCDTMWRWNVFGEWWEEEF